MGDYNDPPSEVPRHCTSEFRRPRYVAYKARLRAKLWNLHVWWLLFGAFTAMQLALGAVRMCSGSSSATTGPCWAALAGGPGPLHSIAHSGSILVEQVMLGLGVLWEFCIHGYNAASVRYALAAADADPLPISSLCGELALGLSRSALPLSAFVLPLLLSGIALWELAACSASDFSGRMTPAQAGWLWPPGQVGEAPWQAKPPVLTDTAASVWVEEGTGIVTPKRAASSSSRRRSSGVGSSGGGGALVSSAPLSPTALSSSGGGSGGGQSSAAAAAAAAPVRAPSLPDSAALVAALASGRLAAAAAAGGAATPSSSSLLPPPRRPSMRVAILTVGTRGDLQPYLCLGAALREAGHTVVLSATDDFAAPTLAAGLEFEPTGLPRIEQVRIYVCELRVHSW